MLRVKERSLWKENTIKIKLSGLIDGLIIETGGFRVFKDRGACAHPQAGARAGSPHPDGQHSGRLCHSQFLNGAVAGGSVKHAYIPDILGKERRKEKPSKEGKLGVEGDAAAGAAAGA